MAGASQGAFVVISKISPGDISCIMRKGSVDTKKRKSEVFFRRGEKTQRSGGVFYFGDVRMFPSCIMTGGNLLIERSKFEMAPADIARMPALLKA